MASKEQDGPGAPEGRTPDPVVTAALGWAVPGAGHLYAGRPGKGLLFFVLLLGTYAAGLLISGFTCVSYSQEPYWFLGQAFAGIVSLVTAWVDPARAGIERSEAWEMGVLYTTVASLLNVLVVLHALAVVRGRAGGAPAGEEEEEAS